MKFSNRFQLQQDLSKKSLASDDTPVPERDLERMWYAGIYYNKTKRTLYIGCVTRHFLTEVDPVDSIEMDCLKPAAAPSSSILEEPSQHLGNDIGVFKGYNVIAGPLTVTHCEGHKWNYNKFPELFQFFKFVEKENQSDLYKTIV